MATDSHITGNVLVNPILKTVKVKGEDRQIAEFRIMSDVYRDTPDGPKQDDERTYPLQVTVWNEALAKQVVGALRAGMRVDVKGTTYPRHYMPSEAEIAEGKKERYDIRCDAERVTVALNRVASITMNQTQNQAQAQA